MTAWWRVQDGNLHGALAGSAIAVLCRLLGTAAGYLSPKGRAKAARYREAEMRRLYAEELLRA